MSISTTLRVPFVFVEFDSSFASQGPALLPYKVLLIGGQIAAATKTANAITRVTSADDARTFYGAGSQLHLMFVSWFANNQMTAVYGQGIADDGAATASTYTLTVTGPATAAGTIYVYVSGVRITVSVANGDAQNAIATAINTAIAAKTDLPVTSGVATNVVTLTAKNKGPNGSDLDVRLNYNEGETLPTGVAVAIAAGVLGATAPTLTSAIAAWADEWFQLVVGPYVDATSLTAIETELASRAGATRMIDGFYITARIGNLSSQTTFGAGRNSQFVVVMDSNKTPTSAWAMAAAAAAQIAIEGNTDPARPFQTLALSGILPPAISERRTMADCNSLLFDGISTFYTDQGAVVRIQRMITMYQKNAANADDTAYLDLNTGLTLMYLRYSFRNHILSRYARAKLADDGTPVPAGQSIITPQIGKNEAVAWFLQMRDLGLVENLDQFKTDLICIRSTVDVNRLEWILPPDLINQFVVGAATIKFRL
jgi:phage tail sheath gpL-like